MFIWLWLGFIGFVLAMLALDLGVFHRKDHAISVREAMTWTVVWVALSLSFNVFVYFIYEHDIAGIASEVGHELSGHEAALMFLTGYLVEKSLSLDNIFVIALIFSYFRVPPMYQHRVLVWGITGALVMRGIMIAAGAALIQRFDWTVYIFGVLLIFTAVRMLVMDEEQYKPDHSFVFRIAKRLFAITPDLDGHHFFTRIDGKFAATPLFLVMLVVEAADVMFAVDSIPAIFAITSDPFLVFTSNVFAILGLRALYFALVGLINKFRYLKESLVFMLAYIGVKMLLSHHFEIPTAVSLSVILGILSIGVLASIFGEHRERRRQANSADNETGEQPPSA